MPPAIVRSIFRRSDGLRRLAVLLIRKLSASLPPDEAAEQVCRLLLDLEVLPLAPCVSKKRIFRAIVGGSPESFEKLLTDVFVDEDLDKVIANLSRLDPVLALRQECYGQEGEDLAVARLFESKAAGFYVDVGAHHPIRFSNTYLLYRRGWRGINIDAMPNSMEEFRRIRPRDINLECLVSSSGSDRPFYILNEPALNTSSEELARRRDLGSSNYRVTDTVMLKPRRLDSILDQYLPGGQTVDLLNVDAEGLDLDVLKSSDWDRYRPTAILVEILDVKFESASASETYRFLKSQGYRLAAKFYNTALFEADATNG